MTDRNLPLDDLGDLAEQAISDKRHEVHDEGQARELFDVPTKDAAQLAERQSEKSTDSG